MEKQRVFLCIFQMKSLTHPGWVQQKKKKKNNRYEHDFKLEYVTIYINAVCVDVYQYASICVQICTCW